MALDDDYIRRMGIVDSTYFKLLSSLAMPMLPGEASESIGRIKKRGTVNHGDGRSYGITMQNRSRRNTTKTPGGELRRSRR